jgi:alkaline phosphatase D
MAPPHLPAIDRRQLLKMAIGAGLVIPGLPLLGGSPARAQFKTNPFTLGVASGGPAPDGFVIWTRLAPEPLGVNLQEVVHSVRTGNADVAKRQ